MLELRPGCEHCNRDLPPASPDARICSFECTFCADCSANVLHNVCPNCGGGFVPRPVRPANDQVAGNCLKHHPASTRRVHKPVALARQSALIARVAHIDPGDR